MLPRMDVIGAVVQAAGRALLLSALIAAVWIAAAAPDDG